MLNNQQTIELNSKGFTIQVSNLNSNKEFNLIDNINGLVIYRTKSKVNLIDYIYHNCYITKGNV